MAKKFTEAHSSRRQGDGARIFDVAKRAGVSPMTVSRVINGGHNVSASTREAVELAISELDYSPNPAARRLAGGHSLRIGLLYSNPSASYISEFLVGGLDEAQRRDAQLVVAKCDPGMGELEVARHLLDTSVDGLILPPPLCNLQPLLDLVRARSVPAVAVASGLPVPGIASVSIDDFEAARAMTKYLISLGHRRIGFIEGSPDQTASARRREGYIAALVGGGLAFDPELVVPGLFTYRSGLDAAERLLDLREAPTAIFASNDDMAAATVATALRRGLDVPRQLTVCGFDDTALATTICPELTTVRQPISEMAGAAVQLLLDEIGMRRAGKTKSRAEPPHVIFEHTLVCRESSAEAPIPA